MNPLIRMTYGHGGSRLERVILSASLPGSAPTPRWLKLLMLAVWFVVLGLASRYAIPTATLPMKTVIDISRLTVKPPPAIEKPKAPRPEQPVPKMATPPPVEVPETATRKAPERQVTPLPEEVIRPSIARQSAPQLPDLAEAQPRISRERRQIDAEHTATPALRPRRDVSAAVESPAEKTAIVRSRGVTAMDLPAAGERIPVVRRTTPGDHAGTAGPTAQRPVMRSERSVPTVEENSPRVAAVRERTRAEGGREGASSAFIGLARGVSLQSLEICASPQLQEEGIMSILRVVGSRQSCTDGKGEFQFTGTKRISSFNLIIYPSPGRKPSNRCEELENAYKCLKAR